MSNERDQVQLQRHIKEAEDRATAGGHELALGSGQPSLFKWEATCARCGEKV